MMTSYTTVEAYGAFPQPLENCPVSQLDPYADEALIDPWEVYAELQRLGSAVWLTKYQMFALTRYDSVMRALKDASLPDGSEDEECPSHPQNNIAIFSIATLSEVKAWATQPSREPACLRAVLRESVAPNPQIKLPDG